MMSRDSEIGPTPATVERGYKKILSCRFEHKQKFVRRNEHLVLRTIKCAHASRMNAKVCIEHDSHRFDEPPFVGQAKMVSISRGIFGSFCKDMRTHVQAQK